MRIFFKKNAAHTGFAQRQNLWRILSGFFVFVTFLILPLDTHAARLFSSGCELQGEAPGNMTDNLEWDRDGTSADSTQIVASIKRSGNSSCSVVRTANGWGQIGQQFLNIAAAGPYFIRFYLYIDVMPAEDAEIASFDNAGDNRSALVLNSDGTLDVRSADDSTILISSTSVLSSGVWYRIEYRYENTTNGVQVRLDGVEIMRVDADGANVDLILLGLCANEPAGVACGGDFITTGTLYFDDIALNDATGLSQNSWPGKGSIVHMQPDGAGDNTGCTAGTFADVDEITPDDTATKCTLTTDGGGDILDTTVESSSNAGLDTYATVSLVQVGAREAAVSAAGESWNLRIKSASGGTVTNGSTVTHDDVTYRTNGDAVPRNYSLTSYTDPTTGVAWTPTGTNSLNNMQIGANSIDANPDINLSTLWALVEYVTHQSRSTWKKTRFKLNGGRYIQR